MRAYIWYHMTALGAGILLDLAVGDPHWFPHPVRLIGAYISWLERRLYPEVKSGIRRDHLLEQKRGTILWLLVFLTVTAVTGAVTAAAYLIHPIAGMVAEAVLTCCALAARSLSSESGKVGRILNRKDLAGARRALSMIVGRDTEELGQEEVIQAAVETVAENTSDGVIAPLLYTAFGGPVLGFGYKAVNTMDSMLGYHNERYEYFGKTAARLDDVFNFVPARISAAGMILSAWVLGCFSKAFSGKGAYRIWKRDRRKHLSPNAAQTESACAGALGIELGGAHRYGGVLVEKPAIGDARRKPVTEDIARAVRLMYLSECLAVVFAGGILALILTGI